MCSTAGPRPSRLGTEQVRLGPVGRWCAPALSPGPQPRETAGEGQACEGSQRGLPAGGAAHRPRSRSQAGSAMSWCSASLGMNHLLVFAWPRERGQAGLAHTPSPRPRALPSSHGRLPAVLGERQLKGGFVSRGQRVPLRAGPVCLVTRCSYSLSQSPVPARLSVFRKRMEVNKG